MIGVLFGAVVAASLAAQGGGASGSPSAAPSCREGTFRIEFGGSPENWAELKGCRSPDGVVTWWPDEQRYSLRPYDGVVYKDAADRWLRVEINGRAVSLWGWRSVDGRPHWRVGDQKTAVADDGGAGVVTKPKPSAATGEAVALIPTGPVNSPPGTGAVVEPLPTPTDRSAIISTLPRGGVVAEKLQGPSVQASDPAEKAKVQTLMETKAGGSGPGAADCDPPEKIPIPPLSRGVGLDWWLVAKVGAAAFALFVGLAFVVASAIVVSRQWRQPSP